MDETIIGFPDESAPQTTANTVRLWSFSKPEIIKDTSKYRANAFGFYTINGNSLVNFQDRSKKENVTSFITEIRDKNSEKEILIILDNFRSHHSGINLKTAELLNIKLIFLPPYSPDLNPIEFIWKSVKRSVSIASIDSEEKPKDTIKKSFLELSGKLTFAKRWAEKFLNKSIIV